MSLDSASSQQGAPRHRPTATVQAIGTQWAVSAGHPLAAEAGARVLAAGGNAIDAGGAAGITPGVVHPPMVSVAGGGPDPPPPPPPGAGGDGCGVGAPPP